MRFFNTSTVFVLGLAFLTGCASSEITHRDSRASDENIPRPGRIIVYAFKATASDVSPTAAITGSYHQRQSPQTPEEIQVGRKLGNLVAQTLVRMAIRDVMSLGSSTGILTRCQLVHSILPRR